MEAKTAIAAAVEKRFPFFPVTVQESIEDDKSLCVRVFAVPPDEVRAVKDFVHELQDRLFPEISFVLLPMVKNIRTTEEHYPEFLRQAELARFWPASRYFAQLTAQNNEKRIGSTWNHGFSIEWTDYPLPAISGPITDYLVFSKWMANFASPLEIKHIYSKEWKSKELPASLPAQTDYALAA